MVAKYLGVVAAGVAGLIASATPEAKADAAPAVKTEPTLTITQRVKDNLPIHMTSAGCSAQSWPNLEPGCIQRPTDKARAVRVIPFR